MELEKFLRLDPDRMTHREAAFQLKLLEADLYKDGNPMMDARHPLHKDCLDKVQQLREAADPDAGLSESERWARDAFKEQKERRAAERQKLNLEGHRIVNELRLMGVDTRNINVSDLNKHQIKALQAQIAMEKGDHGKLISQLTDDLKLAGKADKIGLVAQAVQDVGTDDKIVRDMVLGILAEGARGRAAQDIELIQQENVNFSYNENNEIGDFSDATTEEIID